MLLTHRKLLQSKAIAIEKDLRATLRNFSLKVGVVGTVKFEARIRKLVENLSDLAILIEPLLTVRRVLREQITVLHRRLLAIVRDDDVCRRLMTPWGRPRGSADLPRHRRCSRPLPKLQGGRRGVWTHTLQVSIGQERPNRRDITVRRRKMRAMLYKAAQILLVRSAKWSSLKAWAMKTARHRGMKKAIVALARRLAVIMHRMWVDGTEFRWSREVAAA
jgi:transposase